MHNAKPQRPQQSKTEEQRDLDFAAMQNLEKEMQASPTLDNLKATSNFDANMVDDENSEGENSQDNFPDGNESPYNIGDQDQDEEDTLPKDAVKAAARKAKGNELYKKGLYMDALTEYGLAALLCPTEDKTNAAIYHSNKAACYFMTESNKECVDECNTALELNPNYVKTYIRRSKANEKLDKLTDALNDMNEVIKLDPTNRVAVEAAHRLQPLATAQQEKQKEEMMGKLKDLGNSFLGKFGMSLDNFKTTKDPSTGAYNISMQN